MLLFLLFGLLLFHSEMRVLFQLLFHEPPESPMAAAQTRAYRRSLSRFLFQPGSQQPADFRHHTDDMFVLSNSDQLVIA